MQGLNFNNLLLHVIGLNFVDVSPHEIPKDQKNPHNFWPSINFLNLYFHNNILYRFKVSNKMINSVKNISICKTTENLHASFYTVQDLV
jgi:hypothetical protein